MSIKKTPATLPAGTVRRLGWEEGARRTLVPVWHTNVGGDLFEGRFEVPLRLVRAQPHTNAKAEFDKLVTNNIARWADWRATKGWIMVGTPKVTGPYDPPVKKAAEDGPDDVRIYMVHARFKRDVPIWVPLENAIAAVDKANLYGLKTPEDRVPWNEDTKEDSGIVDPSEYAHQRRMRLGLKREDYLFAPVWEPL